MSKDLSGKRFGALRVIAKLGHTLARQPLYLCRCICGRESRILGHNLTKNRSKTCGHCKSGAEYIRMNEPPVERLYRKPVRVPQVLITSMGGRDKVVKLIQTQFPDCDSIVNDNTGETLWARTAS